jgi:hypothetical protein
VIFCYLSLKLIGVLLVFILNYTNEKVDFVIEETNLIWQLLLILRSRLNLSGLIGGAFSVSNRWRFIFSRVTGTHWCFLLFFLLTTLSIKTVWIWKGNFFLNKLIHLFFIFGRLFVAVLREFFAPKLNRLQQKSHKLISKFFAIWEQRLSFLADRLSWVYSFGCLDEVGKERMTRKKTEYFQHCFILRIKILKNLPIRKNLQR